MLQIQYFAIPQLTTACVSFAASTTMAFMIASTGQHLSVPYRRIIFGLSVADMAQSLSFLTGPISVPSNIPNSWGLGNEATCMMNGLLEFGGVLAAPMYTCFLCWYYLCKLKYRMSDESFARKFERKVHVLIITFALTLSLTALGMDTFHTVPPRTLCSCTPTPLGCTVAPSGGVECDATIYDRVHIFVTIRMFIQLLCILGIIVMMAMIYLNVVRRNRIFYPYISRRHTEDSETSRNAMQEEVSHLSSLYRNEIVCQATCYVGAFCLVYLPQIISSLMNHWLHRKAPMGLIILVVTILPLAGFFNILIYTRPNTASLHRVNPDRSWIYCFWLVLRAGGEVPTNPLHDGNNDSAHSHDQQDHERPRLSVSTQNPFGVSNVSSDHGVGGIYYGGPDLDSIPNNDIVEEVTSMDPDDRTLTTVGTDMTEII